VEPQVVDRDAELLQRCLEGDRETLREIIQRYEVMVYNLSYQMLHNEEDAKDAAQESFLNLFESLPYFRGECSLKTWLCRIVSSQCIARSRRRRRCRKREAPSEQFREIPDSGPSALEQMEKQETHNLLHRAVDELPEKYRIIIVLYYFQDLSYEQIADILLLPIGTVKVRLFRARKMLEKKLKKVLK